MRAWDDAAKKILTDASPHTWLNKRTPPHLVIHGTKDAGVPYSEAELHVKLFRERRIPVDLYTVQDGVHGVMNWEKDPSHHGYKKHLIEWLSRTLR
ncbi:MAG: alpha/beta hydrolase [Acidobacteria bacterium]|nr:alpha/beta hydrolase [Acidobacteriota bacterium]